MTSSDATALTTAEFWDEYYTKSGDGQEPVHEWLRSFAELEEFLRPALLDVPGLSGQDSPLIVHLGSGDSVRTSIPTTTTSLFFPRSKADTVLHQTFPADLASLGYQRQLCVDFSTTVVDLMKDRHSSIPGIEWRLLDLRDMDSVASGSVDVAFD